MTNSPFREDGVEKKKSKLEPQDLSVLMGQPEEGEGTGGEKRKRQTTTVMKARGGSNHSTEPSGGWGETVR